MRSITLMLILLPMSGSALAQAQEDDGATRRDVRYAERTHIDFDVRDITAETVKPTGILVDEVVHEQGGSLLELRRDFNAELSASVDAIK